MRTALSPGVLGAVLSMVLATACGYSPNPENGLLMCGPDRSCPEDYECSTGSFYCFKNGTCHPLASDFNKMIGRWTFVEPSRRVIVCSDGSSDDDRMWRDFFDIDLGAVFDFQAFYYCDLDLNVDNTNLPGGASLVGPALPCSAQDESDPSITYTWTPQVFTLTTYDGCRGELSASIPFAATLPAGTVTCSMDFTGTLIKS